MSVPGQPRRRRDEYTLYSRVYPIISGRTAALTRKICLPSSSTADMHDEKRRHRCACRQPAARTGWCGRSLGTLCQRPMLRARLTSAAAKAFEPHLSAVATRAHAVELLDSAVVRTKDLSKLTGASGHFSLLGRCLLSCTEFLMPQARETAREIRVERTGKVFGLGLFKGHGSLQPSSIHDPLHVAEESSADKLLFSLSLAVNACSDPRSASFWACLGLESALLAGATSIFTGIGPVSGAVGITLAAGDWALQRYAQRSLLFPVISGLWLRLSNIDSQKRTCEHEAGHFLVAYIYGMRMFDVQINGPLSWRALWRGEGGHVTTIVEPLARPNDGELLKRASMMMAGMVAERMCGYHDHFGSADIHQIEDLMDEHRAGWDLEQRENLIRHAIVDAEHQLTEHRSMFDALVEELRSGGSRFGACCGVVADAFDAAGPDWKPAPRIKPPPLQYYQGNRAASKKRQDLQGGLAGKLGAPPPSPLPRPSQRPAKQRRGRR